MAMRQKKKNACDSKSIGEKEKERPLAMMDFVKMKGRETGIYLAAPASSRLGLEGGKARRRTLEHGRVRP